MGTLPLFGLYPIISSNIWLRQNMKQLSYPISFLVKKKIENLI